MFPAPVKTGLTLSKVIGGISKTLNVANQFIPLYIEVKPMINNAKSAFQVAKEILANPNTTTKKTSTSKSEMKTSVPQKNRKKEEIIPISSTNSPVFFL